MTCEIIRLQGWGGPQSQHVMSAWPLSDKLSGHGPARQAGLAIANDREWVKLDMGRVIARREVKGLDEKTHLLAAREAFLRLRALAHYVPWLPTPEADEE